MTKLPRPRSIACLPLLLALGSSAGLADTDMQAALANCRDEARSTGLENEDDITAYVDLCMQAWQNPAEYTEWEPAVDSESNPDSDLQEALPQ